MNETTIKLIHWIWGEPKLADFLREIAKGEVDPVDGTWYEYGDNELAAWISDFVFPEDRSRSSLAWETLVSKGVSTDRVDLLYADLTEGRRTPQGRLEWLNEMDPELIRAALVGDETEPYIYVHATIKGFHPKSRYRVQDKYGVYETRFWALDEMNRQICPEPIDRPCSCEVKQHGR